MNLKEQLEQNKPIKIMLLQKENLTRYTLTHRNKKFTLQNTAYETEKQNVPPPNDISETNLTIENQQYHIIEHKPL